MLGHDAVFLFQNRPCSAEPKTRRTRTEKIAVAFNESQYEKAKSVIHTRIKANIAQDLFDYKRFYQVINKLNNSLEKSLELLKDDKAFSKLALNNQ